jgi:hypothetical protein
MSTTSRSAEPAGARRFLVERYRPGLTVERFQAGEAAIRLAAAELTAEDRPIRYLGATFIPDEETVLAVFEAESAEWVVEANRRAGQPVDRIVGVVDVRGDRPGPDEGLATPSLVATADRARRRDPDRKEEPS